MVSLRPSPYLACRKNSVFICGMNKCMNAFFKLSGTFYCKCAPLQQHRTGFCSWPKPSLLIEKFNSFTFSCKIKAYPCRSFWVRILVILLPWRVPYSCSLGKRFPFKLSLPSPPFPFLLNYFYIQFECPFSLISFSFFICWPFWSAGLLILYLKNVSIISFTPKAIPPHPQIFPFRTASHSFLIEMLSWKNT